jgi:hypothetical protein
LPRLLEPNITLIHLFCSQN